MSSRASGYKRVQHDYYVEPTWAVDLLFDAVDFGRLGPLHDPCAGRGTIVDAALKRGLQATGADIVDRADGRFPCVDFLSDSSIWPNVVSNPPYRAAQEVLTHALDHVPDGGVVALIVPVQFLASQGRTSLFTSGDFASALVLSRRPSMPPGDLLDCFGEAARRNGSTDFLWTVFCRGHVRLTPDVSPSPARSWLTIARRQPGGVIYHLM
jgi:hypothetical protein